MVFNIHLVIPVRAASHPVCVIDRTVDLAEAPGPAVVSVVESSVESGAIAILIAILAAHIALISGVGVLHVRFELLVMIASVQALRKAFPIPMLIPVIPCFHGPRVIVVLRKRAPGESNGERQNSARKL